MHQGVQLRPADVKNAMNVLDEFNTWLNANQRREYLLKVCNPGIGS